MSNLTINVSAKGEAMIATLQKEIFNRRRKKVTASQVVETLVESGAKSQSDKRYAASWKNLIKDIQKAAKVSEIYGTKPANITAEEWALILSHRIRKVTSAKKASVKSSAKKSVLKKSLAKNAAKKAVVKNLSVKATPAKSTATAKVKATKVKTAIKRVASAQIKKSSSRVTSVSKRIVKTAIGKPSRSKRKTKVAL